MTLSTLHFSTAKAIGQFTSVTTKISTPYGKVTIQTMQYAPWMNYNYGSGFSNQKHKVYIMFLNDSLAEAKARINIDDSINTLEWEKKKRKLL